MVWPLVRCGISSRLFNKGIIVNKKIALFSGRYDPVHLGHMITIGKLLQKYNKVIVCILDYPGRSFCDIKLVKEIFKTFVKLWAYDTRRIEIVSNKTHFAYIELSEIKDICSQAWCDVDNTVYVGGNTEVNKHIKELGFPVEYYERSYFYNASSIRGTKLVKEEKVDELTV